MFSEITLIIRNKLSEWEQNNDPWFLQNVKFIIKPDFDNLSDIND